ncbi:S-adenosylmethionine:tRNA ribosyltransferase-isomerase [subsurface metagenome]
MKLQDFNYHLPRSLVAQEASFPRGSSRLLVLWRENGNMEHRRFSELPDFLRKGDVVVLNNTKVIPARLKGKKRKTGGRAQIFLLERKKEALWSCLLKPARRLKVGAEIYFPGANLKAVVRGRNGENQHLIEFEPSEGLEEIIAQIGEVPLPPYIKREKGPTSEDVAAYQTVYARHEGAVAAPTAGLHFTSSLLKEIEKRAIDVVEITLHTGWASFKSLDKPEIGENEIPREYFRISSSAASRINEARRKGGRVVAVGTTTTRALETRAARSGEVSAGEGWTSLFIYPGYEFRLVDALITNFHMPRSSLLLLVAAFVGRKKLMAIYKEAIENHYRFLSFGDAMLVI